MPVALVNEVLYENLTIDLEDDTQGAVMEEIGRRRGELTNMESDGNGRTRLVAESLCDSFEGRDAWLASGMETGVNDGYAKLDALLGDGAV